MVGATTRSIPSSRAEEGTDTFLEFTMSNTQTNGRVATQQLAPSATHAKRRRGLRTLWLMFLLLVGSTAVSFVTFRYLAPRVPRELVGTWQVVDGEMKGATLDFRWYGTGYATMVKQGKKETAESSVRVRGKRIYMTYSGKLPREDDTVIQTILTLTDDELVIRDQDEVTYHLVRIRD
jgi:uncharacterized protein (TIGR03066 family)